MENLKLKQEVAQKQQLYFSQEIKTNLQILSASNLELQEILLNEQDNPYLESSFKRKKGGYTPFENFSLEYHDEISSEPHNDYQSDFFEELNDEILWMNFSVTQKLIAQVIASSIKGEGNLSVSLESIAQYCKTDLESVKVVFEKLKEKFPILHEENDHLIENYLKSIFKNEPLKLETALRYFEFLEKIEKDPQLAESLNEDKKKELLLSLLKENLKDLKEADLKIFVENLYEKLEELLKMLFKINKKESSAIEYLRPDIVVQADHDNFSLQAKVYNDYLPTIRFNENLSAESKEEKEQQKKAKLLIQAFEKRTFSLYSFVELLLIEQKNFFFKGKTHLKALSMKDMAKAMGVHPSTITRIVSKKHFYYEGEIFPLKQLFSKKVRGYDKIFSREDIYHRIEKILNLEKSYGKISDKEIQHILQQQGISIARRTVNKYKNILLKENKKN